ncbi:twin-arginine translocation signal domain-containing protein [Streptomyces sp. NPDC002514]|uniref:twin-arginine translocation signal domain-containing protein n=1 Tax=unclassified Streptomyces TaxID=2593676 RepID=UPI0036A5E1CE
MTAPSSDRVRSGGPSRRAALQLSAVTTGALLAGAGLAGPAEAAGPAPRLPGLPFRLGTPPGRATRSSRPSTN